VTTHTGYYINLDRSPERRVFMEAQLARLNPAAPYHRFAAADGNPNGFPNPALNDAQIGCFTSHYLLLRQHLDGAGHLHVIEDDAVLASGTVRFVEQVIASGMLDELDILFTSTYLPEDFHSFREARGLWKSNVERAEDGTASAVQFVSLPYYAATTSYLVNQGSVRLLHDMIGNELERGARVPIDLFIRAAADRGKLRVRSLFPFITSVLPGEFASTIDLGDDKRRWTSTMDLLRHSFFVEYDPRATLALADRLLARPDADLQEGLHARIAGFITSDVWRKF
jgi:GR25 family glycosyltransferase involved in LPS biosynthesis